jgi:hypothetical protein
MAPLVAFLFAAAAAALFPPTARYVDVDLKLAGGRAQIVATRIGRFAQPTALRRFRGRFTVRVLHDKSVLVEYPFDFPLSAEAEDPDADDATVALGDRFRKGVTATTTVRAPLPDGADTLAIYDTQTKRTVTAALDAPRPSPPAR